MVRIERLFHARVFGFISCLALMSGPASLTAWGKEAKARLFSSIEQDRGTFERIAMETWKNPELGYQEYATSKVLTGIPTAFVASYGSGIPVVGILAEYDALPGMSLKATWYREPVVEGAPGHGCGHPLSGTASSAAGIAVKQWLQSGGHSGTIRVYGTPAEEGGAGKIYMLRAGLFEDLDAVEAMNFMVNLMREHLPQETRIHYVIIDGGKAPNIVPDFAEVFYYVRHPDKTVVDSTFRWITAAAGGAAMGTGTTMESEIMTGLYHILTNETLARTMYCNLQLAGGVDYDEREREFAGKITATLSDQRELDAARVIAPFNKSAIGTFSSDVGDVSWNVPTTGLRTATWVPGTTAHSWQAVAAGGTSIGLKGMIVAAKTLVATSVISRLDTDWKPDYLLNK